MKKDPKEELLNELKAFFEAYGRKDVDKIKNKVAKGSHIVAFGTDIDEIMTSDKEWSDLVDSDFKLMEQIEFFPPDYANVQISENGNMGTVFCQNKVKIKMHDQSNTVPTRIAATFVRDSGDWKIVQWMASFPTEGHSTNEILQDKEKFIR